MFQAHSLWNKRRSIRWTFPNIRDHFFGDANRILWCRILFLRVFDACCFEKFSFHFLYQIILHEFESEYLPTIDSDLAKSLCKRHERIGWPGLLGSLDCSHWQWAKCPKSLQGEYKKGSKEMPTVVYECACDYQLRIWHCNFALPGACNDLNVWLPRLYFLSKTILTLITCTGCVTPCLSNCPRKDARGVCRGFESVSPTVSYPICIIHSFYYNYMCCISLPLQHYVCRSDICLLMAFIRNGAVS